MISEYWIVHGMRVSVAPVRISTAAFSPEKSQLCDVVSSYNVWNLASMIDIFMLFFPASKYPVVSHLANRSEAPIYEILITAMLADWYEVKAKPAQNNEGEQEQEIQFHDNGHALNLFEPIFPYFRWFFFSLCSSLFSSSLLSVCGLIFALCIFYMFLIERSMMLFD